MNTFASPPFRWLILAGLLCTAQAGQTDDPIQTVERGAGDWVKVRTETTRLEAEWQADHALLESTVNALKERAKTLEEKRDNLKARTADDRTDIEGLRSKLASETGHLAAADTRLKALCAGLIELRPALPPRLASALELPYRSLAAPELDGGGRMQYALAILNRCAQFNRLVDSGEEVVTIDGAAQSLEVIYWGLSHGYALDRTAGKAWLGSPADGRWQWESIPGYAAAVARLIAIHQDKADPAFINVPARLALKPTPECA